MKMYSKNRRMGNFGEDIAVQFLMKHNFSIIERNYLKKWGELDIIAQKDACLHFIEVKSIYSDVIHETSYRPEENIHPGKIKRIIRTIESYILEKKIEGEWKFGVIAVSINRELRKAKVRFLENITI